MKLWWTWRNAAEMQERVTLSLAAEMRLERERLAEMRAERDYWRSKAELLLDSTLFRRGEITQPVFSPPPKPLVDHTMGAIFSPLAVTEIESGKRSRPVAPEDGPIR
jgi:hypothetical protein